jgi:phosphoglycolate phosphatase
MTNNLPFQSVTFDLDGTLLDTVADLAEASNRMLGELGLATWHEDDIRRFVGRGIHVLVERCLTRDAPPPPALLERAIVAFKRHYAEVNGRHASLYPGVLDGLRAWQATGLPMAVITNKAAAFTEPLLAAKGLRGFFAVVVSGDTTAHKKPHPEPVLHACRVMGSSPQANLHIGDSIHDIQAAKAAGSTAYCVPYGYNEGRPVRAEDCDALVDSLSAALGLARTAGCPT